ncbi:retrovirus-related pol polyprotein from transposon TNT 1-94 [Tanacetum coccineum]
MPTSATITSGDNPFQIPILHYLDDFDHSSSHPSSILPNPMEALLSLGPYWLNCNLDAFRGLLQQTLLLKGSILCVIPFAIYQKAPPRFLIMVVNSKVFVTNLPVDEMDKLHCYAHNGPIASSCQSIHTYASNAATSDAKLSTKPSESQVPCLPHGPPEIGTFDREIKQVIAQGLCEDGLYVLRDTPMALAATVGVSRKASFELWHNRLGHVSF